MIRFVLSAFLLAISASGSTAKPQPIEGTLTISLDEPILRVEIAGVALRLRVDPDAGPSLVLNPDVVARLPLRWHRGQPIEVGRVRVAGQSAEADVAIEGRILRTDVDAFEQPCCADVDGMIGPELLPFAEVRLVRSGAPGLPARTFALDEDREAGMFVPVPTPAGTVRVRFAPFRPVTNASRSAGVMIASASGGTLDEQRFPLAAPFNVTRPAATLRLARPFDAAGFRLTEVAVRVADFGGRRRFDARAPDARQPGDIVVKQRSDTQHEWPALTLGRDVLGGCTEIAFGVVARTITLACPAVPAP